MRIKNIDITNIGGLKKAFINFHPKMNIICGPNGVGKTTILESVAQSCFNSNNTSLKRHAESEHGDIKMFIIDEQNKEIKVDFTYGAFEPLHSEHKYNHFEFNKKVIYFNTTRTFSYLQLDSISRDRKVESHHLDEALKSGVLLTDMKNWFANRHLFSKTPNALTENNKENLKTAISCFSSLNEKFTFSRVDAKSFDIFVSTPNGEVWYEYLSSGFKSCISLLFGIIKEVELRMPDEECLSSKFDGIILIDEIEMHLHPEWQAKIINVLKNTFPKAQFIVTTHSPHVVQSGDGNQIIALEVNENGITSVRDTPSKEYGYSGWTVEEVLKDVMGMEDTMSKDIRAKLDIFQAAVDEGDADLSKKIYAELDMALHPSNIMRKMLRIDLASVTEGEG